MTNIKNQKTWGGRFESKPSELMLKIGESVSFDQRLALYDIECSRAHATMLAHVKLITNDELKDILKSIDMLIDKIEKGEFVWDDSLEDVHMNIEQALTEMTPSAKKIHTARSRNDQIATDMRLWFKDACISIMSDLETLIKRLITLSENNQEVIIPGYTHLQRAQPLPFSHHMLAYVEMFMRDIGRFSNVWDSSNCCPLGSGAIAGTTLPIDRLFVAKELGFIDEEGNPRVTQNSVDAVSDRDLFFDFLNSSAIVGVHLSRLAEDFILWNSSEFSFVNISDAFTTGSSLMPQKKNPDAFELIRGKSARLIGNSQSLFTLVKGLPLSYNRDLQEDKEPIFDSFDQLTLMLQVLEASLSELTLNTANCEKAVKDPLLLATDIVDYLVLKGIPFRDAHHTVGEIVKLSEKLKTPINDLSLKDVQSVNENIQEDWVKVFSLDNSLLSRKQVGMPNPLEIKKRIKELKLLFDGEG